MNLIQMYVFMGAMAFLWGTCIGSYLNVCIYRIPLELSTVAPRSFCPNCKKPIPWYCNVPIFSYIALGGRCRFCRVPISPRYILVELLVGVLFLMVWLKFDPGPALGYTATSRPLGLVSFYDWKLVFVYWLVVGGFVLGTFIDFEHLILPDRVTIGGMIAGLALSALVPALHNEAHVLPALIASGIGLAVGFVLLWIIATVGSFIMKQDAMGFGDVKLMGAIGAFFGWPAVLFSLVVSSFAGALVGVTLVALGKKKMQSRIPYGPYIVLAALIWMFWGPILWDAYINLFARPPAP